MPRHTFLLYLKSARGTVPSRGTLCGILLMKKFTNSTNIVFLLIIGLGFIILVLPFIFISWPIIHFQNKLSDIKLEKYLLKLGDKNFLCYNNREDAKDFIENKLLPKLDRNIEVIYLDGLEPKSNYAKEQISLTLYKLKKYNRFPHLLKIRGGQIIDESINNEFFNTMRQNKSIDNLVETINKFFGLQTNKNAA